jgi:FtsH-binding integral membrane protein
MNMEYLDRRDGGKARHLTTQAWILGRAAAPLFAAAALAAMWLVVRSYGNECLTHYSYPVAAMLGAGAYGGIWTIAKLAELVRRQRPTPPVAATTAHAASPTERPPQNDHFFITLLGAIGAGALAGWLYALLSGWMLCWRVSDALTAGAPLVMGIFLLAGILHIGLMGNAFHDRKREWWGRLGGWLILWGLVWLAIFWVALYFPDRSEVFDAYVDRHDCGRRAGRKIEGHGQAGNANLEGRAGEGRALRVCGWTDVLDFLGYSGDPRLEIAGVLYVDRRPPALGSDGRLRGGGGDYGVARRRQPVFDAFVLSESFGAVLPGCVEQGTSAEPIHRF